MTEKRRMPLWLDCDTGHDDAFAILLAATHAKADLLGISTVFGNASLANTTYNTRAIVKSIGREDVPIYAGAVKPFCRAVAHAVDIHGETGLDGTTCLPRPTVPARSDLSAVEAMSRALRATEKHTAWLVATGALTNVALLLALYPDLAEHLAGISIMGGAVGNDFAPHTPGQARAAEERIGNWTHWAEFNIYIDPESAKAVFTNSSLQGKIRLVSLDLSHQFIATVDVQHALLTGSDQDTLAAQGTLRKLFVEILTYFAGSYADVFGFHNGPPLHDPLAILLALEPSLFDQGNAEQFAVDVVTDGDHGDSVAVRSGTSQCGRTLISPLGTSTALGVKVPRTLDKVAIWKMIDAALATAEDRAYIPTVK